MKDIFKNYHFFDKCSLRKFSFLNTKHDIIDLCNSNIEDINFDLISIKNIEVDMIGAAMLSRYLGAIVKN